MTKEEKLKKKYPDNRHFHFHNANPKKKITNDCSVRALSVLLDKPYEQTMREMLDVALSSGYMLNDSKCIEKYLIKNGFVKVKQPKKADNTKYTGKEFCETLIHPIYSEELHLPNCDLHRIYMSIGSHHCTAVMSGQIWDTWDCSHYKVGTLYVRPM